eukprot:EG_transcript_10547
MEHRPIPGAKRPFSVVTFESIIRCRDLIFVGDSLMGQFFQAVACMLRRPDTQFSQGWLGPKTLRKTLCPFGRTHCRLASGCATFPHVDARLCLFWDGLLGFHLSSYRSARESIFVVNTGAHHHREDSRSLLQAMEGFVRDYARMSTPPMVLWSEALPQHFPLHPSGYYQEKHMNYTRCVPTDPGASYAQDWRNRIAEHFTAAAGIPVLRLWNLTQPHWKFHVEGAGLADKLSGITDCTHYCLPGAPLAWAVALTDLLETLVTPKGVACQERNQPVPLLPHKPGGPKSTKDKRHEKK